MLLEIYKKLFSLRECVIISYRRTYKLEDVSNNQNDEESVRNNFQRSIPLLRQKR